MSDASLCCWTLCGCYLPWSCCCAHWQCPLVYFYSHNSNNSNTTICCCSSAGHHLLLLLGCCTPSCKLAAGILMNALTRLQDAVRQLTQTVCCCFDLWYANPCGQQSVSHLTRETPKCLQSISAASARPIVGLGFIAVSCCRIVLTCEKLKVQILPP